MAADLDKIPKVRKQNGTSIHDARKGTRPPRADTPKPPEQPQVKLPHINKKFKNLDQGDIAEAIARYSQFTTAELKYFCASPNAKALDKMIAKLFLEAGVKGDPARVNFLLDRSVGKVKDVKEVQVTSVSYQTNVQSDGTLLQEVLEEDKVKKEIENAPSTEVLDAEILNDETEETSDGDQSLPG
jgi:hypothetical protein